VLHLLAIFGQITAYPGANLTVLVTPVADWRHNFCVFKQLDKFCCCKNLNLRLTKKGLLRAGLFPSLRNDLVFGESGMFLIREFITEKVAFVPGRPLVFFRHGMSYADICPGKAQRRLPINRSAQVIAGLMVMRLQMIVE
jgi:hypothetical protein